MKFSTKQIHAGQHPDKETGAVMVPIYQTSTYANDKLGETKGHDYGRTINPTRTALEQNLAALENGKYGFCFSSGMAAVQTVIMLFKPGDHIICSDNVYGGTIRLYEQIIKNFGLEFSYADTSNLDDIKNALKPNTKLIYIETPTNPMLKITDPAAEQKEKKQKKEILIQIFSLKTCLHIKQIYRAFSADSISSIRSSLSSIPTDKRTKPSVKPIFLRISTGTLPCVIETGWQTRDSTPPRDSAI